MTKNVKIMIAVLVVLVAVLVGLLWYTNSGETNIFKFKGKNNINTRSMNSSTTEVEEVLGGGMGGVTDETATEEVLGGGMGGVTE